MVQRACGQVQINNYKPNDKHEHRRTSMAQVAMAPGVVCVKPQSLNMVSLRVPVIASPWHNEMTAFGP
jgi:hypothetical protein